MTATEERATLPGLADAAAGVEQSVVQVWSGENGQRAPHGCGVVWRRLADGSALVVSNAHVVSHEPVSVVGARGAEYSATVVAVDRARDLSLIAVGVAMSDLVPVERSRRSALRPGEIVVAVGHPFGVRNAVSTGVVHAIGPLATGVPLPEHVERVEWVQADLRLGPGNSGGPLVDAEGNLVGLNTMIVGGIGLAVPVASIEAFVHTAMLRAGPG